MKSSLIFSSHNFDKLLLKILENEPQDIKNLILKLDGEFEVHWWQKRTRERKTKYLKQRIKHLLNKGQILSAGEEKYAITLKGQKNLIKVEQRDLKLSNMVKNFIKPSFAFSISLISLLFLMFIKLYGYNLSENPLFAFDGIFFVITHINFYLIITASKNPFRNFSLRIKQLFDVLVGLGVIMFGLPLLSRTVYTLNYNDTAIVIILSILIALISFVLIFTSGYLNGNLDLMVLAHNHRNAIFSPFFIVISVIGTELNLNFVTGLIIIIFGIDIMVEARRSNLGNFTHHILILLNDHPHTYEEMLNLDKRIAMLFGSPMFFKQNPDVKHTWINHHGIKLLQLERLIEKKDRHYVLTKKSIPKADKHARGMIRFFKSITSLTQPRISPLLSLIIHLILGSLKLLGFILTGSVGLLGDGLDSALDGLSSIMVTIAMRFKRETEATYILISLMVISGLGIITSSLTRLISPQPIIEGDFGVIIALLSIVICFLLYLYQRYSGYINRSLTILTQSEDSKNHVLSASLVLLAIAASYFKIYVFDGIVGCFIGILILRGAYEILSDIRSYSQGENVDYGKYQLGLWKSYNRFKYNMFEKWVLYQIYQDINTFEDIVDSFTWAFGPIVIKESHSEPFELKYGHKKEDIRQALVELEHKELITLHEGSYSITDHGSEQIKKYKARYSH